MTGVKRYCIYRERLWGLIKIYQTSYHSPVGMRVTYFDSRLEAEKTILRLEQSQSWK